MTPVEGLETVAELDAERLLELSNLVYYVRSLPHHSGTASGFQSGSERVCPNGANRHMPAEELAAEFEHASGRTARN